MLKSTNPTRAERPQSPTQGRAATSIWHQIKVAAHTLARARGAARAEAATRLLTLQARAGQTYPKRQKANPVRRTPKGHTPE
ncbi:MAG: hypothetical protein QNI84_08110 [Henriciella sp.]|nr:hypothetical protein [Henriciella sp.]